MKAFLGKENLLKATFVLITHSLLYKFVEEVHKLMEWCNVINCKSHQKILVYFSRLVTFDRFILKGKIKKGGRDMAQCPPM